MYTLWAAAARSSKSHCTQTQQRELCRSNNGGQCRSWKKHLLKALYCCSQQMLNSKAPIRQSGAIWDIVNVCEKPSTINSKPDDEHEIVSGATTAGKRYDVTATPKRLMPIHAKRRLSGNLSGQSSGLNDTCSDALYKNLDPQLLL